LKHEKFIPTLVYEQFKLLLSSTVNIFISC
jgi:hypothetical protein